jgi:hypothetical protein
MATTRRSASGTGWAARPLTWPARATPGGRWGIEHRPTGAWMAFGTEARCRALAAQFAEADALLARAGAPPAVPPGREADASKPVEAARAKPRQAAPAGTARRASRASSAPAPRASSWSPAEAT